MASADEHVLVGHRHDLFASPAAAADLPQLAGLALQPPDCREPTLNRSTVVPLVHERR